MSGLSSRYYYGSHGLIRGFGPLCRTPKDAETSIDNDGRNQRTLHEGATDRHLVQVSAETGLCYWSEEDGVPYAPVKVASGEQARYPLELIRACERLWNERSELGVVSD